MRLRIEDVYTGRWFSFVLDRTKERELGIFNMDDNYCIAVSEEMIPFVLLGLTATKLEFSTRDKAKQKLHSTDKLEKEIDEMVYHVYSNELVEIDFFRKKGGRDAVMRIDWTTINISKLQVEELIVGLTKAQKMLSGDNF